MGPAAGSLEFIYLFLADFIGLDLRSGYNVLLCTLIVMNASVF